MIRVFAHSDSAVQNGSFRRLWSSPGVGTCVSTYMNGDFVGVVAICPKFRGPASEAAIKTQVERFIADDMREYDIKTFTKLAPTCCGGKRK